MKKISLVVFVVSIILSSYFLLQAGNYAQRIQDIIDSQPTKSESLFKAFLDGCTFGLTGGGDIFAEAKRLEKVSNELRNLNSNRLEARSYFFFWGVVAGVSLLVFIVVKKEDNDCDDD